MAEQNQVQQVTMKDPAKKVEAGKRLAAYNHRKREEFAQMKAQKSESKTKLTYYGTGTVVAIGVSGVISYYVYQSKTPKKTPVKLTKLHFTGPRKLQPINLK